MANSNNSDNRPSVYYIPENFLGESKVLHGQISTRYLIDSIALSLLLIVVIGLPVLKYVIPTAGINVKLTALVIIMAPGFMLGMIGFNGDPFSVFLVNFFSWVKKRETRLYNENPRLLGTDPVKAMYEHSKNMDKFVNFIQNAQERRIEKKTSEEYVEGKTFEFSYDPSIDGYLEDVGDYSEEALAREDTWPTSTVSISSGSDLDGLRGILSNDGYNEPDDTITHTYGLDMDADDE